MRGGFKSGMAKPVIKGRNAPFQIEQKLEREKLALFLLKRLFRM